MNYVFFGLVEGIKRRRELARLYKERRLYGRACEVSPEALKESGVRALAVDFDGVLANHGESEPLPEMRDWLARCAEAFGPANVHILTNKPTGSRLEFFKNAFPGMGFVSGVRKKPYPDGLLRACGLSGAPPSAAALVDDRLFTGGLASILAGARFIYISKPYINIGRRPLEELFFMAVRLVERLFVKFIFSVVK